jgi:hypothetical protein
MNHCKWGIRQNPHGDRFLANMAVTGRISGTLVNSKIARCSSPQILGWYNPKGTTQKWDGVYFFWYWYQVYSNIRVKSFVMGIIPHR